MCVLFHAVGGYSRGERHWFVTQQRLGPVPLSRLAYKNAALDFYGDVDLRNPYHCNGALRRCHLSNLVQGRNEIHFIEIFRHTYSRGSGSAIMQC